MPPLQALAGAGHDIALVVTQPDRRRARGGEVLPTPVKAAALELGLTVTDRVDDAVEAGAELGVVVAFGRLIRPHVLARLALVNLHFSLLPRWRGAAPVERAILAGDAETGVCLMALEEGLDTGPVYACERVAIGKEETAHELRDRLVGLGTRMLVERLADGPRGLGEPVPQQGEATYAAKLDHEELRLDWDRPAVELHRVVRVGRSWTTWRGKRLLVLRARLAPVGSAAPAGSAAAASAAGDAGEGPPGLLRGTRVLTGAGALELVEVQPEGRAPQPADAWLRGARLQPDERLGS